MIKRISQKIIISLITIILSSYSTVYCQISGIWHNSMYYNDPQRPKKIEVRGRVKSWKMETSEGKSRVLEFDKKGEIIFDDFEGTIQTFIPDHVLGFKMKDEFEQKYNTSERGNDTSSVFNQYGQLVKRKTLNNIIENRYDSLGNILLHIESSTSTDKHYWNSLQHNEPYHYVTTIVKYLVMYRYKNGLVVEIEHYHSDPFKNFRLQYEYDNENNLIETKFYDSYNIRYQYKLDNYLDSLLNINEKNFSINDYFTDYWGQEKPSVEKRKYNKKNQLIELTNYFSNYQFKDRLTFKAEWVYDVNFKLKKEIHYNTYLNPNKISCIIDFDKYGNVIKQNIIGNNGEKNRISTIKIEYY